jgi:hypothetical protein
MDAGVPLATIQRWLGHHNISQTSTYLAASLGGDADEMRAFEERIGRTTSLPQVATNTGTNGSDPISTDIAASQNTQSNVIVPEQVGVIH